MTLVWVLVVALGVAALWFGDLSMLLPGFAILVAGLWLAAFVAMPIVMRRGALVTPDVALPALAVDDPAIPPAARTKLAEMDAALRALGYRSIDLVGRTARAPTFMAAYYHPGSRTRALVRVVMWPLPLPGQKGRIQSAAVELATEYRDGDLVELSNIPDEIPGAELVAGVVAQMPHVKDVRALARYHALLVERFEAAHGRGPADRAPVADDATTLGLLRAAVVHGIGVQRRGGFIEPVPGPTEVYRPTWRTALRGGWARVSPVEEFVAWRVRARGERLARSLDGTTSSERIGRRAGWVLLVVGVVLSIVAAAFSLGAASGALVGIYVARLIARQRGHTPGWRTVLIGGVAATVAFGVIASIPVVAVLGPSAITGFSLVGILLLLPMALLFSVGVAIAIEGFRAAAAS